MGCGLSKIDTELVTLCRERKELIKASKDSWKSLALAHSEYFRSLRNVEHELGNFLGEFLVICSNSSLGTGHGHQTADELSRSKDCSTESGDGNNEDDVLSFDDYVNGGTDSSEPQSENASDYVLNPNALTGETSSEEVPTGVLEQPQILSEDVPAFTAQLQNRNPDGSVTFPPGSFGFPWSGNGQFFPSDSFVHPQWHAVSIGDSAYNIRDTSDFPNHGSMESSNGYAYFPWDSFRPYQNETGIYYSSAMNSLPNFRSNLDSSGASFGGQTDYPLTNASLFQHESGIENNYVMDFSLTNSMHYQMYNPVGHPSGPPYPEGGPPYPEVSPWDFINPFNSVENTFPNYYFHGSYDTKLETHSISEVREREGIPDLEDELDNPVMEDSREEYLKPNVDLDECHSEKVAVKNEKAVYPDGEEMKSAGDAATSIENQKKDGIEKIDLVRASSSASESLKVENIEKTKTCEGVEESNHKELEKSEKKHGRQQSPSQADGTVAVVASTTVVHHSRQLQEVLAEIKDAFDVIIIHGKHVSEILEPFHPSVTLIKESSRASYKAKSVLRFRMSLRFRMPKRKAYRKLKTVTGHTEDRETESSLNSCSLSLTLAKLYIWENKLYEEVKDEEKLREKIDKEWRKLKKLLDRGAEPLKIDASYISVRRLTPRINVAVSKVQGVARRTHNIRDGELQPQLCELIHRLRKMWKFSFESHGKQVQAIIEAQANVEITCTTSASSLEATQKLGLEILNLRTAFLNWTNRYREFVVSLKKWLMKCLHQEQGEIPDANLSSSSGSLSTPALLVICNDWHHAAQKVSDLDVSETLNNFVFLLNQLKQHLHDERQHRLKVEYLSSYHEKKLKKFCMENGMDWDHSASLFQEYDLAGNIETGNWVLSVFYGNLKPLRNEIHEENTKYEQVVKEVHEAATKILKDGILSVLEAFRSFNLEMFSAYEQVRIPNERSG